MEEYSSHRSPDGFQGSSSDIRQTFRLQGTWAVGENQPITVHLDKNVLLVCK